MPVYSSVLGTLPSTCWLLYPGAPLEGAGESARVCWETPRGPPSWGCPTCRCRRARWRRRIRWPGGRCRCPPSRPRATRRTETLQWSENQHLRFPTTVRAAFEKYLLIAILIGVWVSGLVVDSDKKRTDKEWSKHCIGFCLSGKGAKIRLWLPSSVLPKNFIYSLDDSGEAAKWKQRKLMPSNGSS